MSNNKILAIVLFIVGFLLFVSGFNTYNSMEHKFVRSLGHNESGAAIFLMVLGGISFLYGIIKINISENSTKKNTVNSDRLVKTIDTDEINKKCPSCAETIKLEAAKCRYCGQEFSREGIENEIDNIKKKEKEKLEIYRKRSARNIGGTLMCTSCSYVVLAENYEGTNNSCPDCNNKLELAL